MTEWPTSTRDHLVPILRVIYAAERWVWIIRAFAGREVCAALPTKPGHLEHPAFGQIAGRCNLTLHEAELFGGLPVPPGLLWAAPRSIPRYDWDRDGNRQPKRWGVLCPDVRDRVTQVRRASDPVEALRVWELLLVRDVWAGAAAMLGVGLPARAKLCTEQGLPLLNLWTAAHESRLAQIGAAIEQRSALLDELGWRTSTPPTPLNP